MQIRDVSQPFVELDRLGIELQAQLVGYDLQTGCTLASCSKASSVSAFSMEIEEIDGRLDLFANLARQHSDFGKSAETLGL